VPRAVPRQSRLPPSIMKINTTAAAARTASWTAFALTYTTSAPPPILQSLTVIKLSTTLAGGVRTAGEEGSAQLHAPRSIASRTRNTPRSSESENRLADEESDLIEGWDEEEK